MKSRKVKRTTLLFIRFSFTPLSPAHMPNTEIASIQKKGKARSGKPAVTPYQKLVLTTRKLRSLWYPLFFEPLTGEADAAPTEPRSGSRNPSPDESELLMLAQLKRGSKMNWRRPHSDVTKKALQVDAASLFL